MPAARPPSPAVPRAGLRLPLLCWLMLACATLLALLAALQQGLLAHLLQADPTRLTLVILGLALLTLAHGGRLAWRLARLLDQAAELERQPDRGGAPAAGGEVAAHLAALARHRLAAAPGETPPDPRPLQDAFAKRVGRGAELGWFIAELLASLGLVGTVIGFILMLAPLAALDAADPAAMKAALRAMSGGMAVALYTTLAGLAGGVVLRLQGYLLDAALAELLTRTALLAERRHGTEAGREIRHAA